MISVRHNFLALSTFVPQRLRMEIDGPEHAPTAKLHKVMPWTNNVEINWKDISAAVSVLPKAPILFNFVTPPQDLSWKDSTRLNKLWGWCSPTTAFDISIRGWKYLRKRWVDEVVKLLVARVSWFASKARAISTLLWIVRGGHNIEEATILAGILGQNQRFFSGAVLCSFQVVQITNIWCKPIWPQKSGKGNCRQTRVVLALHLDHTPEHKNMTIDSSAEQFNECLDWADSSPLPEKLSLRCFSAKTLSFSFLVFSHLLGFLRVPGKTVIIFRFWWPLPCLLQWCPPSRTAQETMVSVCQLIGKRWTVTDSYSYPNLSKLPAVSDFARYWIMATLAMLNWKAGQLRKLCGQAACKKITQPAKTRHLEPKTTNSTNSNINNAQFYTTDHLRAADTHNFGQASLSWS